jgi:parvulin-like peptidyl-prolyl isomerase
LRIGGALLLLLCVTTAGVGAEVIDRVLAVAAGELIMLSDVTAARDLGLVRAPAAGDPIASILSALVDRTLILVEVDRYAPPAPAVDAVDREVQAVRARFASPAAFAAALSRSGIDENHLRETLREDLRIRTYEEQRFTVPPPSEEDLGRYYREHPQTFTSQGQLVPFAVARADIVRLVSEDRRKTLVDDWVAGLRRRADVTVLYLPGR